MTQWLSLCGLIGVVALMGGAVATEEEQRAILAEHAELARAQQSESRVVRFLAVGDVNLGRKVGQEILRGDTAYPFVAVRDSFAAYDVVFANLESQLSDQKGETQSPRSNLIFTGPYAGSRSLRCAGVTVVSTANNHALDYGVRGLQQTIESLDASGVQHAGTGSDSAGAYRPAVIECHGVRIALLACTDVMNFENPVWKQHVAAADTAKILACIRSLRDSADFILVSYHGGEEYADRPTLRTRQFARQVISAGADLFLGHHPHVPYGVEQLEGKYIVYSLGNFVFWQPDRFWTQRSFAFAADLIRDERGCRVTSVHYLPVRCGVQPAFITEEKDRDTVLDRIRNLSTQSVTAR